MTRQVLIVEDDAALGQLLVEDLQASGMRPTLLGLGKPAADWVRRHRPDLVLLDLMLPDVDGYAVCKELKLDRATNRIPLVMVTALAREEDRVRGLAVGANDYLTKPFTRGQLHAAIEGAFAWRRELERHGSEGEVRFELRSNTRHLEELNQLLASLYLHTPLSGTQVQQLAMAVRELGANAIEWGHRNQADRIVTVTYRIDAAKVVIVIRDHGPGFDPANLPHAARPENPLGHLGVRESLRLREGGFGILMARGLVDELRYNRTGNEVRLVKYYARPATRRPAAALRG
ncbi:MAG TPA: response regulator [Gemmataceae bacterium]|jgi:DNA-binding response OmpR family regulator|nr:response regulator [Gemmataceae bacterium]